MTATSAPSSERKAPSGQARNPSPTEVLGHDSDGKPVLRFSEDEPLSDWTGNIEEMCLYAGQSTGLITDIPSAADLVKTLWAETKTVPASHAAAIQSFGFEHAVKCFAYRDDEVAVSRNRN